MGLAASQARFLGITLRKANCEFKSTELAQQKLELTEQMTDISQEYANALNSTKLTWQNDAVDGDYGVTYSLLMMPSVANDYNPYMISTKSGAIILNSKYAQAAEAAGISKAGGTPSQDGRDKFLASLAVSSSSGAKDNVITEHTFNVLTQKQLNSDGTVGAALTSSNSPVYSGNTQDVAWHYSAGLGAVPKNKGVADATTLSDLASDKNIGQQSLDWLQIVKEEAGIIGTTENEKSPTLNLANKNLSNAKLEYIKSEQKLLEAYYTNGSSSTFNSIIATGGGTAGNGFYVKTGSSVKDVKYYDGPPATRAGDPEPNEVTVTEILNSIQESAQNALGAQKGTDVNDWDFTKEPPLLISGTDPIMQKFSKLEQNIANSTDENQKVSYTRELELFKKGVILEGTTEKTADSNTLMSSVSGDYPEKYKYQIYWAVYEAARAEAKSKKGTIKWAEASSTDPNHFKNDDTIGAANDTDIAVNKLLQTDKSEIGKDSYKVVTGTGADTKTNSYGQLTVVVNNAICKDADELKDMKIENLLKDDIVLMSKGTSDKSSQQNLSEAATAILKYVAEKFGYGSIGTGLNVDQDSNEALNQAFEMTKKKILKPSNAITKCGGKDDSKSMNQNDAFLQANSFNRICVNNNGTAAINLSNLVSAFLTYYDNYLRGTDSEYVVGKGIDFTETAGPGSKTYFVTDNPNYVYVTNSDDDLTNDEKTADFWNELYNNICAHGWRYDDMVEDTEYLESAIKDGRYSLMALNNDGYFYQQRYNDISYMVEETDDDAISRAEAQYTQKKSELTYKEDSIDIKTKKLDAEIAELTTEMSSVQNMISKSIEKTFTMFSS